jgi:hypothetical protein
MEGSFLIDQLQSEEQLRLKIITSFGLSRRAASVTAEFVVVRGEHHPLGMRSATLATRTISHNEGTSPK